MKNFTDNMTKSQTLLQRKYRENTLPGEFSGDPRKLSLLNAQAHGFQTL